ncbi:MAG: hypothetical protein KDA61_08720 [Planctomycetales bacterium]|nr:hypothetical protein [Planctomycetales bacterium]
MSKRAPAVGFSLVETLVATAILGAALAALTQLTSTARRRLDAAVEEAVAARLAANEISRLAVGLSPLETRSAEPLSEDPTWECRIDLIPLDDAPTAEGGQLVEVQASVRPLPRDGGDAAASTQRWRTFARWLPYHGDASKNAMTASPATSRATEPETRRRSRMTPTLRREANP